ncbi:PoNe immunity protein domain-containing protein [Janthinobacterium kumbetense]|uniref:DUF1911 domain-containing protein n=1 Tax=Janthinobacterium kumbetense TaxID=2950280 RepID=A0ABT0WZG1_9BURK|nr:PoNe immunity protein domain-containing protein [Janthinobacterium kumbetense]MCM2569347.1 DUF1911 domain-containing protein [Janthinobacterium kumbetense]
MKNPPFDDRRRQQFIYQELYEKTLENSLALIQVQQKNKESAESAADLSLAYNFLYLENFWIWLLDYTAGMPIEDLAPRLSGIVDKFAEWNEVDQVHQKEILSKYPEYGPYRYRAAPNFGDLADYEDTLQLLSIAILLRDQRSVSRIIRILSSHRGQDGLFEELISAYMEDAIMIDTCLLGKPYDVLLQTVYEDDENSARNLLKKYLKQWYPAMKDHPRWYNGHLRISDEGYAPYYGYWAFEAAAMVFVFDLDDSDIDHLVYPKDLVDYARQLSKEGRYTSMDRNEASDGGHVEGKQPCRDTDFRE